MGTNYNPQIVTNGLVLCLDAANPKSYTYSENLLSYSQQFNVSPWSLGGTGTPSITANTTTAPDGTLTASTLYGNAGTYSNRVQQTITVTASTNYTFSFYIKNKDNANASLFHVSFPSSGRNNSEAYLFWSGNTISGYSNTGTTQPQANYIANGWYRVSMTATATSADAGSAIVRIYPSADDGTLYNNVYIWGAQVEHSSMTGPNPYLVTTTTGINSSNTFVDLSATKTNGFIGANTVYTTTTNSGTFLYDGVSSNVSITNPSLNFPTANYTIATWINPSASWPNYSAFIDRTSAYFQYRLQRNSGTNQLEFFDSIYVITGGTITTGSWNYVAASVGGGNCTLYINGANVTSNICASNYGNDTTGTTYIGRYSGAGALYMGYMGPVHIYNRKLNDNEILQNFNAHRGRYGI